MNKELQQRISEAKEFSSKGNLPDLLLKHSIKNAMKSGLFLEFGVREARTLNRIRGFMNEREISEPIYGFDSFEGLPEDWVSACGKHSAHKKGSFACDVPSVGDNISLVKGWFQDTLPGFLEEHQGPISFAHLDSDLYSSTVFVLEQIEDRIVSGTILEFDEAHGEKIYAHSEGQALSEFLEKTNRDYVVLGKTKVAVSLLFP